MTLLVTPPDSYDKPYELLPVDIDNANILLHSSGPNGDSTRQTHVEIFVDLKADESVLNIPVKLTSCGLAILAIRIRSRSEQVRMTLTVQGNYRPDIHPRDIIYQYVTSKKDELLEFNALFAYPERNGKELQTYLSLENLGADTDGLSVIITFGGN